MSNKLGKGIASFGMAAAVATAIIVTGNGYFIWALLLITFIW